MTDAKQSTADKIAYGLKNMHKINELLSWKMLDILDTGSREHALCKYCLLQSNKRELKVTQTTIELDESLNDRPLITLNYMIVNINSGKS